MSSAKKGVEIRTSVTFRLAWLPLIIFFVLVLFEEGCDLSGALLARLGVGRSAAGAPAQALGTLFDQGPDPRAALSVRRLLAGGVTPEVATSVAVERFQHFTSRTPASYSLGAVGAAAVPLLVPLLEDSRERVRQQAALALGDVGLGARGALPALEKLARKGGDTSSRAAYGALADVAPYGVRGWLTKAWYELPFFAIFLIVLAPFVLLVLAPRLASGFSPDVRAAQALGRTAEIVVALLGLAFLALAVVDLAGPRVTVEADVWFLAIATWCLGSWALSVRLRRSV